MASGSSVRFVPLSVPLLKLMDFGFQKTNHNKSSWLLGVQTNISTNSINLTLLRQVRKMNPAANKSTSLRSLWKSQWLSKLWLNQWLEMKVIITHPRYRTDCHERRTVGSYCDAAAVKKLQFPWRDVSDPRGTNQRNTTGTSAMSGLQKSWPTVWLQEEWTFSCFEEVKLPRMERVTEGNCLLKELEAGKQLIQSYFPLRALQMTIKYIWLKL